MVLLLVFLGRSVWGVYQKDVESREKAYIVTNERDRLDERAVVLRSELERLSTPEGTEEEIRKKFDVGHQGEKLLVIVESKDEKREQKPIKKSVFTKFWEFLTQAQ